MPKKTCPNGHVYDTSIYGDQCPMCPAPGATVPVPGLSGMGSQIDPAMAGGMNPGMAGGPGAHTHIAGPAGGPVSPPTGGPMLGMVDPMSGETRVRPQDATPSMPAGDSPARTVIRRAPGAPGAATSAENSRRLVGFLVTYNRTPMGKAYNLYEGRNYIGRDPKCGICIPDDDQLSGTHMSIMYRNVDSKFKFRDEQSSNGTFVNKELLDDGELKNYDIIRAGSTIFIFMAIPLIN